MLKIKFPVTQEDIDQGRSGPDCPIELALKRINYENPRVYTSSMRLNGMWPEFNLPLSITNWIYKFDSEEPVSPTTFELEVPDYAFRI